MTREETPPCPSDDGHAWVSGQVRMDGLDSIHIMTVQCRRCGYESPLAGDPEVGRR